jgi:NAD(P)-dependent dehydrogenase (short-subunit alcohol dehydrogenase family)
MTWSDGDIPDLTGRTAVVTGANSGIGLETAAALAAAGATVALACRNPERAQGAMDAIAARQPRGRVEALRLDLSSLAQIAEGAAETNERFERIHLLINNAGVMAQERAVTTDGFELLFGVNHLGHFAYTAQVLPRLLATPGSRVVTVTSLSYRFGRIRWDDLALERRYSESRAYSQSKLANAMFALQLQRRLASAGAQTSSLAAHPGFADTQIIAGRVAGPDRFVDFMRNHVVQTPAGGAAPSLRAATDPGAFGGQFYGPAKLGGVNGPPRALPWVRRALDEEAQERLWRRSEDLTGVRFPV